MMRRLFAIAAVVGLVAGGAITARADSQQGTLPACADIAAGAGTYNATTDALHMEVRLNQAPCSGDPVTNEDGTTTTTTVSYALYVIRDKTPTIDENRPHELANLFNLTGPWDQIEFVTDTYSTDPLLVTEIAAPGAHVITYDVEISDDDPVVCVFSLVSGSTVTTQQVEVANEPVDENGNGNTEDDVHNGNGGKSNKDGDKFDLGTHTETEEVSRTDFFDRAPTETLDENGDPVEQPLESTKCLPIDAVSSFLGQVLDDVTSQGGRGYN